MAPWKARVEFLLSVIELLFLSVMGKSLQGKACQDSLLSGGGRSVRAKISGGRGRPWGILFGFYKTRHILLSDSANCTVLPVIVLTQYRRVTDGWTDGIAVASTALAMRALQRAVKMKKLLKVIGKYITHSGPRTFSISGHFSGHIMQRTYNQLKSNKNTPCLKKRPTFGFL